MREPEIGSLIIEGNGWKTVLSPAAFAKTANPPAYTSGSGICRELAININHMPQVKP